MDKDKKMDIVSEFIQKALEELHKQYPNEIYVVQDNDFNSYKIELEVLD